MRGEVLPIDGPNSVEYVTAEDLTTDVHRRSEPIPTMAPWAQRFTFN
jgi:hypothetical protein